MESIYNLLISFSQIKGVLMNFVKNLIEIVFQLIDWNIFYINVFLATFRLTENNWKTSFLW